MSDDEILEMLDKSQKIQMRISAGLTFALAVVSGALVYVALTKC